MNISNDDLTNAIRSRHSVRSYTDKKIEGDTLAKMQTFIAKCNKEADLNIQLCVNEPKAFTGMLARYGKFYGVNNYIALVGKKDKSLEEKCGYYGEIITLVAQHLGLNTCWVAASYSKRKTASTINPGEKQTMVVSIGYGATQGVQHKSKPIDELFSLADGTGKAPDWFVRGVEAARLAPTAMNQQKFRFHLDGDTVHAKSGNGFYTKTDLGIAKCHFEIGAGDGDWKWGS